MLVGGESHSTVHSTHIYSNYNGSRDNLSLCLVTEIFLFYALLLKLTSKCLESQVPCCIMTHLNTAATAQQTCNINFFVVFVHLLFGGWACSYMHIYGP